MVSDFNSGLLEEVDESVVLFLSLGKVRLRRISPSLRIGPGERIVMPSHEHRAERVRHALASITAGHVSKVEDAWILLTLGLARGLRSNNGFAFCSTRESLPL